MKRTSPGLCTFAGFTLVELMVVIAIIGIMTALVIPEMRGSYSDAVLRAGGRDLIGVCGLASSRAVSFSQEHRVRIDPATRKFRVEKRVRGTGREPVFVPVRDVPGCEGELDGRITVRIQGQEEAEATMDKGELVSGGADGGPRGGESAPGSGPSQGVTFYPDGTADRVEIMLRDRDGFGLSLRLNPITARVRVLELKRS